MFKKQHLIFMFATLVIMGLVYFDAPKISLASCSNYTFTRNLYIGSTGSDVRNLQFSLNCLVGTNLPGTTYFGIATRAGLIKYQKSKGITPTYGYFGPITKTAINSDLATGSISTNVPNINVTNSSSSSNITPKTPETQNNTTATNPNSANNTPPTTTTPPVATNPPTTSVVVSGLTLSQSEVIKKDLQTIKSLGFKRIRIITYVRYSTDSFYTTWPANVFITFPKPKDSELTNLKQYLQLVDQAGLQYEFVLLMPDSKIKYYTNSITGQDYKNFIDAIWPTMWTGKLDSILVGGDMSLNPPTIDTQNPDVFPTGKNVVDSHRQWLLEMWPYMNAKCPGCNIGVELLTGYAKFWDAGASNLSWVKSNLSPQPKFVGVQYYPTTPTALTNLGFKQGSVINWDAAVKDWYENLKTAAGGIPILADEIGLDLNLGFTQQDQADFYKATTAYLVQNGIHFNVWEFADHPGIGLLGLMGVNRILKPSATAIKNILTPTLPTAFTAGIQYTPPESVGWQFIMPNN